MIVKMSNMFLSALISVSDPCVVKNDFDFFCNLCIAVMTVLANNWGVTYGTANVVLFVILMPLIIVLFFCGGIIQTRKYVRKDMFLFRHCHYDSNNHIVDDSLC